jgi:hypothetical protein
MCTFWLLWYHVMFTGKSPLKTEQVKEARSPELTGSSPKSK